MASPRLEYSEGSEVIGTIEWHKQKRENSKVQSVAHSRNKF
jgi:hypothetical protein